MRNSDWNLLVQTLMAAASIGVALTAIWGNWIRYRLVPPRLRIQQQDLAGEFILQQAMPRPHIQSLLPPTPTYYYRLRVTNDRTWSLAKNCKVLLTEFQVRQPNGNFSHTRINAPLHFTWTSSIDANSLPDISHEQIFDFGILNSGGFSPALAIWPNNFSGTLTGNNTIRYLLRVIAEGVQTRIQTFEVSWDGIWPANPQGSHPNLIITEIN